MQNRDVHHSSSAKVNPAGKCFILLHPFVIKHLKIKWLPNLPLFTWLSQVAGGTQGIPPIHRNHDAIPGEKRNQGYRNGILVIMIYPLYPCINISVVWHIFRHLLVKYRHLLVKFQGNHQKGANRWKKKQQAKLGFFNFLLLGSLILLTLKTSEFHFRGAGHWRT